MRSPHRERLTTDQHDDTKRRSIHQLPATWAVLPPTQPCKRQNQQSGYAEAQGRKHERVKCVTPDLKREEICPGVEPLLGE